VVAALLAVVAAEVVAAAVVAGAVVAGTVVAVLSPQAASPKVSSTRLTRTALVKDLFLTITRMLISTPFLKPQDTDTNSTAIGYNLDQDFTYFGTWL
jgi:hypothetical protein